VTREGTSLDVLVLVWEVEEEARRGGRGRKLQDPDGRWDTSVKISVMRRCWIVVSYIDVSAGRIWHGGVVWMYKLCVELGQTWLTIVVEHQDCVDHRFLSPRMRIARDFCFWRGDIMLYTKSRSCDPPHVPAKECCGASVVA